MKFSKLVAGLALVASSAFFSSAYAKLQVVTSFTILEDITKNIAGDYADVVSLTPVGAEIHDYEPTPRDLIRLTKSDLIITNGMDLERWFSRFYARAAKKVAVVEATQGLTPDLIPSGPYQGKPNPHTWMSLSNAKVYVQNITNALVSADPENKDHYLANAQAYQAKLDGVIKKAYQFIEDYKVAGKYLITSESAFSYLAKDLKLNYDSIWPINAEDSGSPAQIKRIVEVVRNNNVKVVFSGSTMDPKPMQTVAKETGAVFGGYLYVDTLSPADGPVPTYLDMLEKTVESVINGFKKVEQPQ